MPEPAGAKAGGFYERKTWVLARFEDQEFRQTQNQPKLRAASTDCLSQFSLKLSQCDNCSSSEKAPSLLCFFESLNDGSHLVPGRLKQLIKV